MLLPMKSKGTKSTHLIKNKYNYEERISKLTLIANQDAQQLDGLKSKIAQSKPLLETIYTKMKSKQNFLQRRVGDNEKRITKAEEKVKAGLLLHEEAVRTIKDMGIDMRYDGKDNYPTSTTKYTPAKAIIEEFARYRQRIETGKNSSRAQPPKPIKTQHVYEQYQERLKIARSESKQRESVSQIKERVIRVTKDLKLGIDTIKRVREQFKQLGGSLYSAKSKTSKSEARFKIPSPQLQLSSQVDSERVHRFLEQKQKRMHEHRDKL